jgi:uncharacterized membrane protein YhaH (DUF805 family)
MEWYLLVWKRYAEFNGRSRRKEYWMFALFNMLVALLVYIPAILLTLAKSWTGMALLVLFVVYTLAGFIPSLAVGVRRLHDTGKSGWWFLISLIPLAGGIIFLVFMVLDGNPGINEYGPNPKLVESYGVLE